MEEIKSKSQKKRDADFLQKTGIELASLSLDKLEQLSLTDQLKKAILDAKTLKSHGAIRRHAQLIGKLMRAADHETILAEYASMCAEDRSQSTTFHATETWRERLIKGGKDTLTEFVDAYKPTDVQQLRQLIKKAADEKDKNLHTGASKALFRYLRDYL